MDPNYLLDLTDDNRTITKEILLDFVRSDAADRANLAVAHQAGDTKALNMLAHRIKGGARSIGAVEYAAIAEDIEKGALKGIEFLRGDVEALERAGVALAEWVARFQ